MNCEALRELLWAYLENETTAEETAEIEKHLAGCAACREELEAQKAIMETLQNLPDEELPEGYHAELMQKLQAEAAPNVVPFPVKKKQPRWKQLSMIAAAVFVVVAAGGMQGMLDMRQNQYEAVQDVADMAPADEESDMTDVAVEAEPADAVVEVQQKQAVYNVKNAKTAPAAGTQKVAAVDVAEKAPTQQEAATPAAISETEKGQAADGVSPVVRSAETAVTEKGTLLVADLDTAMTDLQKAIADAKGTAEVTEYTVCTEIPTENFEGFCEAVEEIGQLNWLEISVPAEGTAVHKAEIELKTN